MKKIGHGVLTWEGSERRSKRYGHIVLLSETYHNERVTTAKLDQDELDLLVGKRVRLVAEVVAARKSGHVGDMFLKIEPSQPEVGQRFDLGVGTLDLEWQEWASVAAIQLVPKDGREMFWFDPRQLYQLHDQTVDLFVEKTRAPFSKAPDIEIVEEDGVLAVGDGYFQTAGGRRPKRLAPTIEKLGGGLFVMSPPPSTKGARIKVTEYED